MGKGREGRKGTQGELFSEATGPQGIPSCFIYYSVIFIL